MRYKREIKTNLPNILIDQQSRSFNKGQENFFYTKWEYLRGLTWRNQK